MTRHVVFGAGLIGGYLGGALMAAGQSVGWVVRPATQEKLARGLVLTDYDNHHEALHELQFVDPKHPESVADILWLTVKCTALDGAIRDMADLVGPQTLIICLQNGLGAEQQIQAAFPDNRVIRGIMAANVAELSPGHLHRGTEGGIDLPALTETQALQGLSQPLLPFKLYADLEALIWAKLQLNLNNPVNALSDIPLKQQLEQRGYRRVLAAAMRELLQVAEAKGLVLPKLTRLSPHWIPRLMSLPDWLFARLASQMLSIDPKARSSMWEDLSTGRKTEIDFLNGAVVREGQRLGIGCPANRRLYELVQEVERGDKSMGFTAGELWQLVKSR